MLFLDVQKMHNDRFSLQSKYFSYKVALLQEWL